MNFSHLCEPEVTPLFSTGCCPSLLPYPVCSQNNELCPSRNVFPLRPIFQNTILTEDKNSARPSTIRPSPRYVNHPWLSSACPSIRRLRASVRMAAVHLDSTDFPEIALLYDSSISNRAQVTVGKNQYFSLMKNKNKI